MSELSDYLENAVLNLTLNGTAFTAISTPYLALFTADPTDAGTGAMEPVTGTRTMETEVWRGTRGTATVKETQ